MRRILRSPAVPVFLCGLGLRLGYLLVFAPGSPVGDEGSYSGIAQSLLSAQGYSLGGRPTLYRPPSYPLLLAAVYAVAGVSPLAVGVVQAFLGAFCGVVVYLLGLKFLDQRWAMAAAFMTALDPFQIFYTNKQVTEVFFILLALVSLWLTQASLEERRRFPVKAIVAGCLWALAALCRPSVFMFVWVVPGVYFFIVGGRRAAVLSAGLLAGFLALTTPWAWRNKMVTGQWVFTTAHGGWTFWEGLNPNFQTKEDIDRWQQAMAREREAIEAAGIGVMEMDRYFWKKSKDHVRRDPVAFAKLSLRKLIKFWRFYPYYPYSRSQRFLSVVYFAPLALLAAVSLRWVAADVQWLLLNGFLIYFTLIHIMFWVQIRYRVPLHPILAIYAAAAFSRLSAYWSKRAG